MKSEKQASVLVNWLNMREAVAAEFKENRGMAVRVAEILNRDRSNLRSTAVQVRGWVSGLYVPRANAAAKLMAAIEQTRTEKRDEPNRQETAQGRA